MLAEIFTAFLITSLAGSCLAAVIALLKSVTKRIFSASWRYYIWLAVLLVMMLPIHFSAPRKAETAPTYTPQMTTAEQTAETNVSQPIAPTAAVTEKPNLIKSEVTRVKGIIDGKLDMFAFLWLIGAVTFFLFNIIGYIRLLVKLRRGSTVVPCPELKNFTDKRVTVRVWDNTSSPFTIGIFMPTLVLPASELTTEQLLNILRHETTHLKRKDILYKWFAVLVKCVHWFNPVIYYVVRQINAECEISCDLSVVRKMSAEEEQSYVNTILSLLPAGRSAADLTTGMTGSKKALKRRFEMIKNKKKTSKAAAVVSAILAAALLTTTVFASGVFAGQLDGAASSWADTELKKAEEYGLVGTWYTFDDYQKEITREEFCEIAEALCLQSGITLYGNGLMEEKLTDVRQNQNSEVLDMYCMGIVPSKTETQFCPNDPVTQEDAAVFLQNLFDYVNLSAFYGTYNTGNADFRFTDNGDISESARDSVYSMYQLGIMRGDGSGYFYPKQNLTAEKCVVLLTRLYELIHNVYDNAENLVYSQFGSIQFHADNGENVWRLDPEQTSREYARANGIGDGEITALSGNGIFIDAIYTAGETDYHVELFKPARQDETGIWVVKRFVKPFQIDDKKEK